MRISCVIVTYGNRFQLLSKVTEAVSEQAVDELIVIDNNSSEESQKQINNLAAESPIPVKVIRFTSNTGSSNGFRAGMETFLKSDTDFIWILDDDNKPANGALQKLVQYWNNCTLLEKEEKLMLTAFREDRPLYLEAIIKKNPDLILPAKNNFCGFHIKQFFIKIQERIFHISKQANIELKPGKLNAAAYGGLFFHRKLLANTPLPNLDFFLYMDDFAFTYSFLQKGGEIWLITDSIIEDIEPSYYLPKRKKIFYHSALDGNKDYLVYYAVRNNVYFTLSERIDNKVVYRINEILFLVIISIIGFLRGKRKKLKVLYDAIKDGKTATLGINNNYPIE